MHPPIVQPIPFEPTSSVERGPRAFFHAAYQTFQDAERVTGGPIERSYKIDEFPFTLRFAGPALAPLVTPALDHLATSIETPPLLTVCVWESMTTQAVMPSPPWLTNEYLAGGEIRSYNADGICTSYRLGADVLSMLDVERRIALYWTQSADHLPYYECSSPFLAILHWWLEKHNRQLVHAGAVGTTTGGVLLVGKSGAGKSTASLACLEAGLRYVSDDFCLISLNPEPYVHSLYNSGKVHATDVWKFPNLASALSNRERLPEEKGLYFFQSHFPSCVSTGFPLRAILLPRVTGLPNTTLKPISPSASLLALAPSTIFQLPGARQQAFSRLSQLVKHVPGYALEVGTDLATIPAVISQLLSKI